MFQKRKLNNLIVANEIRGIRFVEKNNGKNRHSEKRQKLITKYFSTI